MNDNKRTISSPSADKNPKFLRLVASSSNNRDNAIITAAVPKFESGNIAKALGFLAYLDEEENGNDSMFAGWGWTPASCATLVSNDPALEKAVRVCFEKESLDPLREYS